MEEMLPAVADQVTAVLLVPLMLAENCWLFPVCIEAAVGEMATLTLAEGGAADAMTRKRKALDFQPVSVLIMSRWFAPAWAMSAAERVTVALVELSTVVGRREPFHSTTHCPQKLRPAIFRVRLALPAKVCDGKSALKTGTSTLHSCDISESVMGSSARENDTSEVRRKNKAHHLVTGGVS